MDINRYEEIEYFFGRAKECYESKQELVKLYRKIQLLYEKWSFWHNKKGLKVKIEDKTFIIRKGTLLTIIQRLANELDYEIAKNLNEIDKKKE